MRSAELVRALPEAAIPIATAAIVLAFHNVTGRLRGETAQVPAAARRWLAGMGAALFLLIAVGHWLGRYELLFSPTGTVFGVGWTDDHINLPGRTIMAVVAALVAVFLAYSAFRFRGLKWVVGPVGAWVVLLVLGRRGPEGW